MNILTIPLTAVGLFMVAISYHHLHSSTNENDRPMAPKTEQKPQEEHEQRSPGKPGAAIKLLSDGTQELELMQSKKLALILQSYLGEGIVQVSIKPDESLELLSATNEWTFDLAQSPQMILPVEVLANRDGVHHLNIFVHQVSIDGEINGENAARALAVEFNVGNTESLVLHEKQQATSSASYPTVVRLSGKEEIY